MKSFDEIVLNLIPDDETLNHRYSIEEYSHLCSQIDNSLLENRKFVSPVFYGKSGSKETQSKYRAFHNYFFHEMKPLLSIAQFEFAHDNDILVQFSGNNEPFDGVFFRLLDTEPFQKVELTRAVDEKSVALFKEHFKKFGSAPGIAQDIKPYKKGEALQKHWPIARKASDALFRESDLCKEAIRKKMKQKYKNAWLGVTFNDSEVAILPKEDYDSIFSHLISKMASEISPIFNKVFFIGTTSIGYIGAYDLN